MSASDTKSRSIVTENLNGNDEQVNWVYGQCLIYTPWPWGDSFVYGRGETGKGFGRAPLAPAAGSVIHWFREQKMLKLLHSVHFADICFHDIGGGGNSSIPKGCLD